MAAAYCRSKVASRKSVSCIKVPDTAELRQLPEKENNDFSSHQEVSLNKKKGTTEPALISSFEAAKMLGIGRSMIYKLLSLGQIPKPIKIGSRSLWSVEQLKNWIKNNEITG